MTAGLDRLNSVFAISTFKVSTPESLRGRRPSARIEASLRGTRISSKTLLQHRFYADEGIGLAGSPQRIDEFLRHAQRLVSPDGQILCDSIDVCITE
jgi:hypothetical protein